MANFGNLKLPLERVNPFLAVLIIFLIYALTIILLTWPVSELSITKSGVFGDSFGAINALFAGLGFAGLWTTLKIQQQQIKEQRDEIVESKNREEGKNDREIFFELLKSYRENMYLVKDGEKNGIDVIKPMLDKAYEEYRSIRFPVFPYSNIAIAHEAYAFQTAYKKAIHPHDRIFSSARVLIEAIENNKNGNYEFFKKIFNATLSVYEKEYIVICFILKDIKTLAVVHKIFSADIKTIYSPSSRWRGALEYTIKNGKIKKTAAQTIVDKMKNILSDGAVYNNSKFSHFLSEIEKNIDSGVMYESIIPIIELQKQSLATKDDATYNLCAKILKLTRKRIKPEKHPRVSIKANA